MKKENILSAALITAMFTGSFSALAADTTPEKLTVNGAKINFTGSVVSAPVLLITTVIIKRSISDRSPLSR